MYISSLIYTSLLALSVSAAPADVFGAASLETRDDDTFNIHVYNQCKFTKQVAIYGVSSSFEMIAYSDQTNIESGKNAIIKAPFKGVGLRLSGHAEWTNQWQPQALFEFGYSSYAGQDGTAYDLSLMAGSDDDISMAAYPIANGKGSGSCESKICYPWAPVASQCWTNPDQIDIGSPADTVCYKGKTSFKVVYCAE